MAKILLDGQTYTYFVQLQPRKTLQLQLCGSYALQIKAPLQLQKKDIIALLRQKAAWIQKKNALLTAAPHRALLPPPLSVGAVLPFLGRSYTLQITESQPEAMANLKETEILVNVDAAEPDILSDVLLRWYVGQAKAILTRKTAFWCEKIGTTVQRIAIRNQKTRWGSCSSRGNINYNWRIVMAPESTIDYLVIHEVSHRIHLNHSPQFWELVGMHCPDYHSHKLWLKENGKRLFQILE